METKTAFCYQIDHDVFRIMTKILRNPDVTGEEINGAVCSLTSYHDVLLSVQSNYWGRYNNDEIVSVRLLNNDTRHFVVLKGLLKEIETGTHFHYTNH